MVEGVSSDNPYAEYESDFKRNGILLGHNLKSIGDTVVSNGKTMTFVGTKSRNTKYPVIAVTPRGALYKLPLSTIQ